MQVVLKKGTSSFTNQARGVRRVLFLLNLVKLKGAERYGLWNGK
jgi:hypothetical protein